MSRYVTLRYSCVIKLPYENHVYVAFPAKLESRFVSPIDRKAPAKRSRHFSTTLLRAFGFPVRRVATCWVLKIKLVRISMCKIVTRTRQNVPWSQRFFLIFFSVEMRDR